MEERTLQLVCPSERQVVGTLTGHTGLRFTADEVLRRITFQGKWKNAQTWWKKSVADGSPLRCCRCGSMLYLKAPEDSLEVALATKLGLTLGGVKVA